MRNNEITKVRLSQSRFFLLFVLNGHAAEKCLFFSGYTILNESKQKHHSEPHPVIRPDLKPFDDDDDDDDEI